MTKSRKSPRSLTRRDYEVGYGKPPTTSQFRKGQSGNPNGRPKQRPRSGAMLAELINKPIKVRIDGKTTKLTLFEILHRRLVQMTLAGDLRAARMLMDLWNKYDEAQQAFPEDLRDLTDAQLDQLTKRIIGKHGVDDET